MKWMPDDKETYLGVFLCLTFVPLTIFLIIAAKFMLPYLSEIYPVKATVIDLSFVYVILVVILFKYARLKASDKFS